jgi:hypothetical protein
MMSFSIACKQVVQTSRLRFYPACSHEFHTSLIIAPSRFVWAKCTLCNDARAPLPRKDNRCAKLRYSIASGSHTLRGLHYVPLTRSHAASIEDRIAGVSILVPWFSVAGEICAAMHRARVAECGCSDMADERMSAITVGAWGSAEMEVHGRAGLTARLVNPVSPPLIPPLLATSGIVAAVSHPAIPPLPISRQRFLPRQTSSTTCHQHPRFTQERRKDCRPLRAGYVRVPYSEFYVEQAATDF